MNKTIVKITICACWLIGGLYAQPLPEGVWAQVDTLLVRYAQDSVKRVANLLVAQSLADNAVQPSNSRYWLSRGRVYLALYEDPQIKQEKESIFNIFQECYQKAFQVGVSKPFERLLGHGLERCIYHYEIKLLYDEALTEEKIKVYTEKIQLLRDELFVWYKKQKIAVTSAADVAVAVSDWRNGRVESSQKSLQAIISRNDKHSPHAYFVLYKIYENSSKRRALDVLQEALRKYPSNPALRYEDIQLANQSGDPDKILRTMEAAAAAMPKDKALLLAIADIYDKAYLKNHAPEDFQKAEKNYQAAIRVDPDFAEARYGLGSLYYNQTAYLLQSRKDRTLATNMAINALREFIVGEKNNPNDLYILNGLAEVYRLLGDKEREAEIKKRQEIVKSGGRNFAPFDKHLNINQ